MPSHRVRVFYRWLDPQTGQVAGASNCSISPHLSLQAGDFLQGDMIRPEPENPPPQEPCFQVFFEVGIEPGGPVVAAVHPDSALHLNQHAGLHMRKIGPPG